MELFFLIALIVITTLRVWFIEARHDYWVCMDTRHLYKRNWHLLGNLNEVTHLLVTILLVALIIKWIAFLLIPIIWLTWWINHDFAMGYYLWENIWKIGNSGFDGKMKRIFLNSGILYFIFKAWWLLLLTGAYISLIYF